jgi:hypothetical protein
MEKSNEGLKILIYSFWIFALLAIFACYLQDYLEDHRIIEKKCWSTYVYLGEFENAYRENGPIFWNS